VIASVSSVAIIAIMVKVVYIVYVESGFRYACHSLRLTVGLCGSAMLALVNRLQHMVGDTKPMNMPLSF